MKNPILTFTSIAAITATALGATLYLDRKPAEAVAKLEAPAQPDKNSVTVAKVDPPEQAPAEQQAAVAPAPTVKAVPEAKKKTELAVAAPPAKTVEPPAPRPVETVAPKVAVAEPEPQQAAPIAPSFDTVRVEPTGDAVIAGRAAPNADVTVKWNGNVVGTTIANADGSFVVVPAKALKTGIGAMTIEMTKDGKVTTSEGSVFVVVKKDAPATVAKVNPQAPTQVVQSGAATATPKDLQLTSVDYDTAGNIVFSGVAAPGSTVRFYVNNAPMGEGRSDANGKWSFAGTSSVKRGTHMLRADALDASGKVLSRIELPFLRESVETVAAAQLATAAPAEPQPVARSVVVVPPAAAVETQVAPAPAAAVPALTPPPGDTQVAAAPATVVKDVPRKLVIQPGNNLWKLSREVYGKGRMYTIIYDANRDQLKNPNRIYPGQILTAPKKN